MNRPKAKSFTHSLNMSEAFFNTHKKFFKSFPQKKSF